MPSASPIDLPLPIPEDPEKNIAELRAKENEIDEVYGEWLRAQRHDVDIYLYQVLI